jgi:hypothetical protein
MVTVFSFDRRLKKAKILVPAVCSAKLRLTKVYVNLQLFGYPGGSSRQCTARAIKRISTFLCFGACLECQYFPIVFLVSVFVFGFFNACILRYYLSKPLTILSCPLNAVFPGLKMLSTVFDLKADPGHPGHRV